MKQFLTNTTLLLTLLFAPTVFAQATDTDVTHDVGNSQINLGGKQTYGIKATGNPNANAGAIISNAILILFIIGGMAVLIFIIWGAFDWITAGGDKEKIAGARRKIINSLIGLALLAMAGFIVSVFGQIVGFDPLSIKTLPRLDDNSSSLQAPVTGP